MHRYTSYRPNDASEFVHQTIVGLVSLADRSKSPASRNRDAEWGSGEGKRDIYRAGRD